MNRTRILIVVLVIVGLAAFGWLSVRDRVMWSRGSKIAWHQDGVSGGGLPEWHWEVKVDGGEAVLLAATCTPGGAPDAYNCEASLPSMTLGRHVLEFRSWHTAESGPQRGQRQGSSPSTLNVIVLPKVW